MHSRIRRRRQALGRLTVANDVEDMAAELLDLMKALETMFAVINLALSDSRVPPLMQSLAHARDTIEKALQRDLTAIDLLPSANATLLELCGKVHLMRDEFRARISG
ncbi:MAG: hypothetical protein ABMA14_20535 [Hyphomonadaceae bacterium]